MSHSAVELALNSNILPCHERDVEVQLGAFVAHRCIREEISLVNHHVRDSSIAVTSGRTCSTRHALNVRR